MTLGRFTLLILERGIKAVRNEYDARRGAARRGAVVLNCRV
jgi:hypothetical protein